MARADVDPEAAGQPGAEVDPEKFAVAFATHKPQCDAERQEVLAAGGLHILGTERHESRRIDNQLRGRAGRQGDPGSSRFFLSLEDDLMRIFGAERISGLMERLGMKRMSPSSTPSSTAPSRTRRRSRRPQTSTSARACSNTTTS